MWRGRDGGRRRRWRATERRSRTAAGRSRTAAGAEARPEMGGLGRRRECGGGDGDAERQRGDGNGDDAKIWQPGSVDVILALQCRG